MKKRFAIVILLLLVACLFALGACKEGDDMENITIYGTVGEKVAVNAAFDWENPNGDSAFTFVLKNEAGATVVEEQVSAAHYELASPLTYGAKYTLTVTSADGKTSFARSFETVAGSANLAAAKLSVCEPYKSHMVLQRGKALALAGTTEKNTLVILDFYGARYYATSDSAGAFSFTLPAMQANDTPTDITLSLLPDKKLVLTDVLVGDVYLFAGQSNMWWLTKDSDRTEEDVTNAIECGVRYYVQSNNTSTTPIDTTKNSKWFKVTSANDSAYLNYSAVSFMVGSMLGKELQAKNVPIGILYAAQGDTNIANWLGKDYYDGEVATKNGHYNAMVHPLRRAELTGVVWYQGCNNSGHSIEYKELLEKLFANWRALFRNETLPFYVVQLPVYDESQTASNKSAGNPYDFSYVRESQLLACEADENAYLIATCDGGDPTYIHPTEKRYICERITKSILSTRYGEEYLPQGPTYKSFTTEGARAIITVNNGEGLHAEEVNGKSEIVGFMLAGADGKYYDATATIEGDKIIVTSDRVSAPAYIKYGFSKCPFLNIYNKDGFLMSPFRTDLYNRGIDLLDYREDAPYTMHPAGSEMTYRTVTVNGETGLEITKANDGIGFGSLQLYKWGAIGNDELGMKISVIGTNSGANVLFRIVEGSNEIWAFKFKDDFTGKREFSVLTSDLECAQNLQDGVIDYQKITNVDVVIEHSGGASITVLGVKFVEVERTKPMAFSILESRNDERECTVTYSPAAFATSYRVIVSTDGTNYKNPIFDEETADTKVTFDPALCKKNLVYYVKVIAKNELGETVAKNSGATLRTLERLVLNDFDYADEASLQAYLKNNVSMHESLTVSRAENGIKITSRTGWQYLVFNVQKGVNQGYNTLRFYMDAREFKGDMITIDLNDENYTSYSYTLNLGAKAEGYFEIPLTSFKTNGVAFKETTDVIRILFNFNDYSTGDDSIVYLDDLELLKK